MEPNSGFTRVPSFSAASKAARLAFLSGIASSFKFWATLIKVGNAGAFDGEGLLTWLTRAVVAHESIATLP